MEEEVHNIPGIKSEQVQILIDLLRSQKSSSHEHMSGIKIGLLNGDQVGASMEGIVKLDNCLTLKHVLFVPKLQCELISISQLMDENNCHVQLTPNLCVI